MTKHKTAKHHLATKHQAHRAHAYLLFDSLSISAAHVIRRIHAIILSCAQTPCPLLYLAVHLQWRYNGISRKPTSKRC